ncbi:DUF305 domain-containing protein [Nocardioides sp.]|uniref:DUF305 domain-containing protein n=1 Tax=Nocardioides sp. TaxID=35761 RepID=UPI00351589EE
MTSTTSTNATTAAPSARRRLGRVGALALTAVLALSTAACGGHDGSHSPAKGEGASSSSVPASEPFNTADITFATDMIQHHAQALVMVDLTQGRTLSAATSRLVEAIREAQTPEIETMTGWLRTWDRPVPATVRDHVNGGHSMEGMDGMDGMDHGGAHDSMPSMPGMMSQQQMDDLAASSDADFERLWLQMMLEHHEGAVTMARTEVKQGEDADAVALARSIIASQSAEIDQMRKLLDA